MTVSMLRFKLGYRPIEASDATTGLETLDCNRDVQLLLTDLVLPGGVDGVALARRARQLHPKLPVVFMSGYPDATSGALASGTLFLRKPFSHDELARILRAGLETSKLHQPLVPPSTRG